MTSTSQTVPGVATATPRTMRRGAPKGGNPANAGWLTKLVLVVVCFLWVVPTFGLLLTSFRPLDDANNSGWWTIFAHPAAYFQNFTFSNYTEAADKADLNDAFINSFAIALPATFIPLLLCALPAHAVTFMDFPGRNFLFLAVVALLIVPNYVAFVPILKAYNTLNLSGFPTVWLAHIGFGMSLAIYILRNYMGTLPNTVIESAKI